MAITVAVTVVITDTTPIAHRKCCPVIGRNSSVINVTSSHQYEVQLDVTVAPGNCSVTEGFR